MGVATGSTSVSPIPAAPPEIGLLVSAIPAQREEMAGGDWKKGVTYRPEGCTSGRVFTPTCGASDESDYILRGDSDAPDNVDWLPYILSIEIDCSTFDGGEQGAEARISEGRRVMESMTEYLLAYEFWTGEQVSLSTLADDTTPYPNTWLADTANVDVVNGAGLDPIPALACLESYLGRRNGGQQGMIHASPGVVSHWQAGGALTREGNRIYTVNRNIVIASPGYIGTSPTRTLGDNNVWAYATDLVRYWVDPEIQITDLQASISVYTNEQVVIAQRVALAEWQRCRHGGVRINVPACEAEGS